MTTKTTPEQARILSRCLNGPEFHADIGDALRSLAAQVEALTAEREAALKLAADRLEDAERWIWFSACIVNNDLSTLEVALSCFRGKENCTQDDLDAAIDAARVAAS